MTIHDNIRENMSISLFRENPETGDDEYIGQIENILSLNDVRVQAIYDTKNKYYIVYKNNAYDIGKHGSLIAHKKDSSDDIFGLYDRQLNEMLSISKNTSYDEFIAAEKEQYGTKIE